LRNQKHPPRLRRQFKPKRPDGRRNNRGNAPSMHADQDVLAQVCCAPE